MYVFPSGTHLTAESTEETWIKCLAQGHNILMQPGFELLIVISRNCHLPHMTNMQVLCVTYLVFDGVVLLTV